MPILPICHRERKKNPKKTTTHESRMMQKKNIGKKHLTFIHFVNNKMKKNQQ